VLGVQGRKELCCVCDVQGILMSRSQKRSGLSCMSRQRKEKREEEVENNKSECIFSFLSEILIVVFVHLF
jgi:hypothetical protein